MKGNLFQGPHLHNQSSLPCYQFKTWRPTYGNGNVKSNSVILLDSNNITHRKLIEQIMKSELLENCSRTGTIGTDFAN